MIPFLMEMKRIHDETLTDPTWLNAEFDPPGISWNIGVNDFTRAVNITPPQSVCTVYFRPMPGMNPELLLEQAGKLAEQHGLEFQVKGRGLPSTSIPNLPSSAKPSNWLSFPRRRPSPMGPTGCSSANCRTW